jgi:hypothetical protein
MIATTCIAAPLTCKTSLPGGNHALLDSSDPTVQLNWEGLNEDPGALPELNFACRLIA